CDAETVRQALKRAGIRLRAPWERHQPRASIEVDLPATCVGPPHSGHDRWRRDGDGGHGRWASTLTTVPLGSSTKKRRTPHGSLVSGYTTRSPRRTTSACTASTAFGSPTSIPKRGGGFSIPRGGMRTWAVGLVGEVRPRTG